MPRDILSDYGRDSGAPQRPRASNGGQVPVRDVRDYSPPQGPKGIMESATPGLQGSNAGTTQRPTANDGASGGPGIGGTNHGCCGSQSKY